MSSSPKTLADLKSGETPFLSSQNFYASLKELRKSTLSITNRLHSILRDAEFVQAVAAQHDLPVIANERCGSWYVPPQLKAGSAYFKSTDGHTGQWAFSLRRLNLHVLEIIGRCEGCIIVDSTRRGKVMPDAFSKTVGIWCAVVNRALFPEVGRWHGLQIPGGVDLPESEVAQIEGRLEGFVVGFLKLGMERDRLRRKLGRPMRLRWVVGHCIDVLPVDEREEENGGALCHNVILCSASRRVVGAEMSEGGYIQGAGDDSEGWSQGMTPEVFWRHKDVLSQRQEDDLPGLIDNLLLEEGQLRKAHGATLIEPTDNLYIGSSTGHLHQQDFDLVIECHARGPDTHDGAKQLHLKCDSGKLGSRNLRKKLHDVKAYAENALEQNPASRILITCEAGKDLSVGVALMLLCLFYSHDGRCMYKDQEDCVSAMNGTASNPNSPQQQNKVDKSFIRQRLAWITSSKVDANPSRSTLQSVNAYLINRP